MTVEIVPNMPIDSSEINALRLAAWDHVSNREWELVLARSLGWVCAVDGDRLVGFVNVAWDGGSHAFLLDTTVHPDHQRRGFGQALVQEAAALARARDVEWLHVDFEEKLEPFYRSCGFRRTAAGLPFLAPERQASADALVQEST